MNKEMIISSTSHETRVAILEDDQVVEVFIEREQSRGVVGNIYKGRVSKVLPGMQSAFVDLGLERDAFLYVTDVISPTEEALEEDEDEVLPAAAAAAEAEAGNGDGGDGGDGGDNGDNGADEKPDGDAAAADRPPAPGDGAARAAAGAATGIATARRRRPGSRICSRKGRRSSSRSSRSRSAPRARASRPT